ncbi:cytidylyltransferase domain-containing protein [Haloimpatiens sp. FM7330]|uniref:acylneuraminate cytidylyltransferase family protein n=1 Tax=Haloimpatiens sp. FM7330 TaxID=3298610 RepID=UPI003634BB8E
MIDNKKVLAIIPARGGSKGVPRKNIKLLNGKPLIAYTIEEAKKSKYIDKIIVSTEDEEIASISKNYGAEVPFLRPKELARDNTPGIEPVIHCVEWLKKNWGYISDYVCLLQCTSPFRKGKHIHEALNKMFSKQADSIISLCESEQTPYWMKKIKDGKIKYFLEQGKLYERRQDIPKTYITNGAIYIIKSQVLLQNKTWYTENTIPYIMDKISSIDIDTLNDFELAEFYMKKSSINIERKKNI